jgi:hypothetical protein
MLWCSSRFRSEDTEISELSDVGCFSNCRSAFFVIFDCIFVVIIKQWFSWVLWICRGLWYGLINYRYYCFVKLQNWIGGISFICVWSFSLHTCSYRGQSAVSNLYCVGLSLTVEFMHSRIIEKWLLPQKSSWAFHEKSRWKDGSVTVRSIDE